MSKGFRSDRACGRQRGVTLIETLLATAVTGALAASVVPNFGSALMQQQLTTTTNEFVLAMQVARAEATTRARRVAVAPRTPGQWASGWQVFVDQNDNGRADDEEPILQVFDGLPKEVQITPHFGNYRAEVLSFDNVGNLRRPGSSGLMLGRMKIQLGGGVRSVCFSALSLRTVRAATCS